MKHVSTTKINDNPHTSNESIDVLLVFFFFWSTLMPHMRRMPPSKATAVALPCKIVS